MATRIGPFLDRAGGSTWVRLGFFVHVPLVGGLLGVVRALTERDWVDVWWSAVISLAGGVAAAFYWRRARRTWRALPEPLDDPAPAEPAPPGTETVRRVV